MNKQALRMAIAECYGLIENNLGINMTARDKERIACGAFGLHIIDLLLSEQEEAGEIQIHVIQVPGDSKQEKPKRACPHCGNEEFGDGAKFCRICGLPLFVAKS